MGNKPLEIGASNGHRGKSLKKHKRWKKGGFRESKKSKTPKIESSFGRQKRNKNDYLVLVVDSLNVAKQFSVSD